MRFGGESMKVRALEVSELNEYIRKVLIDDPILNSVMVKGEISNLKYHSSGNIYLSIKDKMSKLNCMIYKSDYDKNIKLEDGKRIIATGYINSYVRDGIYQLYIKKIEIEGVGDLYLEFLKLKEKLEKMGMFSATYKKPIPKFPKSIGVITSPTGAVIRDIINVVTRRYPKVDIKLYPVSVQGVNSAKSLVEALEFFNIKKNVDTIIIGRGGGSLEELWSFNEEIVAKAVFDSKIPIISAVGHETDFTICDFVSDMRAPTPSAAAEIATPNLLELTNRQSIIFKRIVNNVKGKLDLEKNKISVMPEKYNIYIEKYVINDKIVEIDKILDKTSISMEKILSNKKDALNLFASSMANLNPFNVLDRGYSLVEKNGVILSSVNNVEIDDEIGIRLIDGNLKCKVNNIKPL